MNTSCFTLSRLRAFAAGLVWLFVLAASQALLNGAVLDDFNATARSGWKDFTFQPGLGTMIQAGGRLTIDVPAVGQPLFAATTKTTENYELKDGRTIEFRVDLISGNSKDSFAILSWIPASGSVSALAGYSIAKSSTDILITKGLNKYFYAQNPTPPIKNDNVTLVLSLTQKGTSVIINCKVLDKDANNAVLFDKTFVDTAAADVLASGTDSPAVPFTGPGNFVLMGYADYAAGGPSVYEVVLDNAVTYVNDTVVLDDFNDNTKSDWKEFTFQPGLGSMVESGGQFQISVPSVKQPLFAAATKTSTTLTVADGQRITLSVDLVSGNSGDSFAVLSWIPLDQSVSALAGYSLAKSSTDILITKGLNKYFLTESPTPAIKNDNVTLQLSLTGEGQNVVIQARVLDKDADNAVIFDRTFVDTPGTDVLGKGTDSPAAPYTGKGNFVLIGYADYAAGGPDVYQVVLDNATISTPPAVGNVPPSISEVTPAEFSNFLAPSAGVSFKVTDDKSVPDAGITLFLNGAAYGSTNGLVLGAAGTNRTAAFKGLQANINYDAVVQVVDADGATNQFAFSFDTFDPASFVVEAEDYNFDGGHYINNPVPIPETSQQANSYRGAIGTPDVDYKDQRTSPNSKFVYRDSDFVGTKRTLDLPRQKFVAAGGADADVYDYDIGEIRAGEYVNYTRSFAAGTYEVYLRESLFNGTSCEAVLERVDGSNTDPAAPVTTLGSFFGRSSGTKFRNVALTDGSGKSKIVVKLSGVTTLRLRQVSPDPADGSIYQNYLVFVPAAGSGVLRAGVASLSPADGTTLESVTPSVTAVIQNRDTTVKTNTIALTVDDTKVTPSVSLSTNGIVVSYSFPSLPAAGSGHKARLVFSDSDGVAITNDWKFTLTYRSLDATVRRVGTPKDPGFAVRVVQAPQGSGLENSLTRAEDQLAANSKIPAYYSTNVVSPVINFTQNDLPSSDGYFEDFATIPGLSVGDNGNDDIAMEILTWLDLPAGPVRFGVRSDDGYKIASGPDYLNPLTSPLAYHNGGPADETVDVVVPQAGLYPFRMIWYERGGGAHVEWFTVDPVSGDRTLINDGSSKAIKAWVTPPAGIRVGVQVATAATGPFADLSNPQVDETTQTITLARPPVPVVFARLKYLGTVKGAVLQIQSISISGSNIILKYSLVEPR